MQLLSHITTAQPVLELDNHNTNAIADPYHPVLKLDI